MVRLYPRQTGWDSLEWDTGASTFQAPLVRTTVQGLLVPSVENAEGNCIALALCRLLTGQVTNGIGLLRDSCQRILPLPSAACLATFSPSGFEEVWT